MSQHQLSGNEWTQTLHQFKEPEDSLQDSDVPNIWTALSQSHGRWKTGIHTKNAMDAYLAVLLLRYSLFIIPLLVFIIWFVWWKVCDNINNWINHLTHVDNNNSATTIGVSTVTEIDDQGRESPRIKD